MIQKALLKCGKRRNEAFHPWIFNGLVPINPTLCWMCAHNLLQNALSPKKHRSNGQMTCSSECIILNMHASTSSCSGRLSSFHCSWRIFKMNSGIAGRMAPKNVQKAPPSWTCWSLEFRRMESLLRNIGWAFVLHLNFSQDTCATQLVDWVLCKTGPIFLRGSSKTRQTEHKQKPNKQLRIMRDEHQPRKGNFQNSFGPASPLQHCHTDNKIVSNFFFQKWVSPLTTVVCHFLPPKAKIKWYSSALPHLISSSKKYCLHVYLIIFINNKPHSEQMQKCRVTKPFLPTKCQNRNLAPRLTPNNNTKIISLPWAFIATTSL